MVEEQKNGEIKGNVRDVLNWGKKFIIFRRSPRFAVLQ
jgi:hypothetical protein